MDRRFFFITTHDTISGKLIADIINEHNDIFCGVSRTDPLICNLNDIDCTAISTSIDNFITVNKLDNHKLYGNAQRHSAQELHHRILSERTHHAINRCNILVSPKLRAKFILNNWLSTYGNAPEALNAIQKNLRSIQTSEKHHFHSYHFFIFLNSILKVANREHIDASNAVNWLFILALTKAICYDSVNIPIKTYQFNLETDLADIEKIKQLISHLSNNQIKIDPHTEARITKKVAEVNDEILHIDHQYHYDWHDSFIEKVLDENIQSIYYPHLKKSLKSFYNESNLVPYSPSSNEIYSKLISIQLNSNRPSQLISYFDNIEETAANPTDIEVIVNIDDGYHYMEDMLLTQARVRPFTIKYVKSPKPKSFCDLWMPLNTILEATDPNAYFLLNISDEMFFCDKGWDIKLKRYVGYFPDHIFRLRASRNKFRNYFDRWECSFAQDSIPITTKKWVDLGGDWNPCFGPDSFQQLVSFYMAEHGKFSNQNFLREIPLTDINFTGDIPSLGIDPEKRWKHISDHITAMMICQSYKMQLEAKRRASILIGNIIAHVHRAESYRVKTRTSKRLIEVADANNNIIFRKSYNLNRFKIAIINNYRKLRFNCYFGDGSHQRKNILYTFLQYARFRRQSLNTIILFIQRLLIIQTNAIRLLITDPIKLCKLLANKLLARRRKNKLLEQIQELHKQYSYVCLENEKLRNILKQYKLDDATSTTQDNNNLTTINFKNNVIDYKSG